VEASQSDACAINITVVGATATKEHKVKVCGGGGVGNEGLREGVRR
jgi:hypothetical protein